MKDAMKKVCENELPHIYNKLDIISKFLETLKPVIKDVEEIKNNTKSIRNQEKLGRKEKAAIVVAIIASIASIAVAYLK